MRTGCRPSGSTLRICWYNASCSSVYSANKANVKQRACAVVWACFNSAPEPGWIYITSWPASRKMKMFPVNNRKYTMQRLWQQERTYEFTILQFGCPVKEVFFFVCIKKITEKIKSFLPLIWSLSRPYHFYHICLNVKQSCVRVSGWIIKHIDIPQAHGKQVERASAVY
jgi:hypothetical protein